MHNRNCGNVRCSPFGGNYQFLFWFLSGNIPDRPKINYIFITMFLQNFGWQEFWDWVLPPSPTNFFFPIESIVIVKSYMLNIFRDLCYSVGIQKAWFYLCYADPQNNRLIISIIFTSYIAFRLWECLCNLVNIYKMYIMDGFLLVWVSWVFGNSNKKRESGVQDQLWESQW